MSGARTDSKLALCDCTMKSSLSKPWQRHVLLEDGSVDPRAYTFCALDELRTAIRRRDVFVSPSWRYADPRIGLLIGGEWDTARPIICRTLGFTSDPAPVLSALAQELDQTYRAVAARLPNNSAVRFETVDGRKELVLSPFDKLEEPPSLLAWGGTRKSHARVIVRRQQNWVSTE